MKGVPVSIAMMMLLLLAGVAVSGREPQHFPQELAWSGKPTEARQRAWLQETVFPEFVFQGTLEEAIDHLMTESRKYSPDGRTAGSFVLREVEKASGRINVRLRGRNALELIDNLCALTGYNWTLAPYAISIYRP